MAIRYDLASLAFRIIKSCGPLGMPGESIFQLHTLMDPKADDRAKTEAVVKLLTLSRKFKGPEVKGFRAQMQSYLKGKMTQ